MQGRGPQQVSRRRRRSGKVELPLAKVQSVSVRWKKMEDEVVKRDAVSSAVSSAESSAVPSAVSGASESAVVEPTAPPPLPVSHPSSLVGTLADKVVEQDAVSSAVSGVESSAVPSAVSGASESALLEPTAPPPSPVSHPSSLVGTLADTPGLVCGEAASGVARPLRPLSPTPPLSPNAAPLLLLPLNEGGGTEEDVSGWDLSPLRQVVPYSGRGADPSGIPQPSGGGLLELLEQHPQTPLGQHPQTHRMLQSLSMEEMVCMLAPTPCSSPSQGGGVFPMDSSPLPFPLLSDHSLLRPPLPVGRPAWLVRKGPKSPLDFVSNRLNVHGFPFILLSNGTENKTFEEVKTAIDPDGDEGAVKRFFKQQFDAYSACVPHLGLKWSSFGTPLVRYFRGIILNGEWVFPARNMGIRELSEVCTSLSLCASPKCHTIAELQHMLVQKRGY